MNEQRRNPAAAVIPQREDDPKAAYERIQKAIEADRDKLTRALAAVRIKPERFLSVVDQALRRQPRLLQCTPSSVLKALLDAAELGLVPSGLVGQAYLVPYRNKVTKRLEAQLIPGYRGLLDLARRSGEVRAIEARIVRANDEFEVVFGTDGLVRHVPYINRNDEKVEFEHPDKPGQMVVEARDGGPVLGAYMIATLTDGVKQVEWMSTAQIDGIRRRSKAAYDGPWVTDYDEMAKKTVTRRGVKYLPISVDSDLNRALALEDAAESSAMPTVKIVTSESRLALEGALGIEQPSGEDVEIEVETDADGNVRPPNAAEEDAISEAFDLPVKCKAPDAEGNPCLKEPGHEPPHSSALYVWRDSDEAGG
jgi:recombination protein RecT